MHNHKSFSFFKGTMIFLIGLLLTACAKQSASKLAKNIIPNSACIGNSYLQKYACSEQRISQAAQSGDPDAQYALGYLYYYGIGTIRDKETATLWINRAAKQGQPLAKKANSLIANADHIYNLQHHHAVIANNGKTSAVIRSLQKKPRTSGDAVQLAKGDIKQHDPRLMSNAPPMMTAMAQARNAMTAVEMRMMAVSKKHYTLQLMAGLNVGVIQRFIKKRNLGGKAQYYSAQLNHEKWYMLVYGNYPTVMSAQAATRHLPPLLRKLHPWVKSYRIVQDEIRLRRIVS